MAKFAAKRQGYLAPAIRVFSMEEFMPVKDTLTRREGMRVIQLAVLLALAGLSPVMAADTPLAIHVYTQVQKAEFADPDSEDVAALTKRIARDFDGNKAEGFRWVSVEDATKAVISIEIVSAGWEKSGTTTVVGKDIVPTRDFIVHGLLHAGDYTTPIQSTGRGAYLGAYIRDFRHSVERWIKANTDRLK